MNYFIFLLIFTCILFNFNIINTQYQQTLYDYILNINNDEIDIAEDILYGLRSPVNSSRRNSYNVKDASLITQSTLKCNRLVNTIPLYLDLMVDPDDFED